MIVLYLGPKCEPIEHHLTSKGHNVIQTEQPFNTKFLEINNINFGISYRYRHIIKKKEIDWFCGRLINLHIAFLPFGRGADPNIWSYLENTPKGVTIHKVDEGIDTGPILVQRNVHIEFSHDTLDSSYGKLSKAIELLFIKNCEGLLNEMIEAKPQNCNEGSFHYSKEKEAYTHLWAEKGWETPVAELIGKAIQPDS